MMQYLKKAKERTAEDHRKLRQTVSEIIENVCESGDRALHEYSRRFDASDRASSRVSRDEIEAAYAKMTEQELADLKKAKAHIEAFAKAQPGSGHSPWTSGDSGKLVLLLCTGRQLSFVLDSADADHAREGGRRIQSLRDSAGRSRNRKYSLQNPGCHGSCRRG